MMKFITTIGAFSLTFILSVALIGVPKSISDFLAQDVGNGFERDVYIQSLLSENSEATDVYTSAAYKQVIGDYTEKSENLDDSDLPADFQEAWRDHVAAWREHSNFLNQSRTHCKMRKIQYDDDEFLAKYGEQNAEITRTWFKVLSAARKHGVSIPRNYY